MGNLPQVIQSRRDLMSYTLSLLRTSSNEHRDSLPYIDLAALKHVAYAFDGLMFFLRVSMSSKQCCLKQLSKYPEKNDKNVNNDRIEDEIADDMMSSCSESECSDESEDRVKSDRKEINLDLDTDSIKPCVRTSSFFRRSNSTLCLGAKCPDPFEYSIHESLPLAVKPHLLQPYSRTLDLFKSSFSNKKQHEFNSLKKIGLISSKLRQDSPLLQNNFLSNFKCKKEK